MLNIKIGGNSHGARKIIAILSIIFLPAITFAQNYGFGTMGHVNRELGYNGFHSTHSMLGLMSFLFILPVIGVIVVIALFIFWLMMLIDAIKHSPEKIKIVWVLVIIFTHIVGAFVYYFVEKRQREGIKKEHTTEIK